MEELKTYIEECEQRFFQTIKRHIDIKDIIKNNKNISQGRIGKLLGISQSYVSLTIREYNKNENEIKRTEKIEYFYIYNDIEEAEYIQKLKKMISDTKDNVILPIIENSKLIEKYKVTYKITAKYRAYMLHNISQIDYYNMLPEDVKEKSGITIEELIERKPKIPQIFNSPLTK